MRALLSSLTIVAVLLHVLLGCHAHHGHAAELAAAAEPAVAPGCDHHHGDHEGESPSDGEQSCDCNDCKFSHARADAPDLAVTIGSLPSNALADACDMLQGGMLEAASAADPHLSCDRPLLYCILRN